MVKKKGLGRYPIYRDQENFMRNFAGRNSGKYIIPESLPRKFHEKFSNANRRGGEKI
jgi:hypothetical protein